MQRNSINERNPRSAQIAAALPEALVDLDISDREVAKLSGVSRSTIARIRSERAVRPDLLLKVATALLVIELHTPAAS